MNSQVDIAVVGSGFAGSLTAMIAKRLGRSVVLLERGRHPRFAIGESSTPLANLLLEELARSHDLPALLPLTKWGSWQRERPELACGLKRGFSFFHHRFGEPFTDDASRSRQLLVAASPHDGIADTHWYRADFDPFLVHQARELGVDYLDEVGLDSAREGEAGMELVGHRRGKPVHIKAGFVMDATGPRGFLHQAWRLPENCFAGYPKTEAIFSHFTDVRRFDEHLPCGSPPPYPPDDAAVHHVFPGGWLWMLRFNNGVTSAGAAVTADLARELDLADGATAWGRLLARLPSLAELFRDARPVSPFIHQSRLAFRSGRLVGRRWAMLPSAAGFVDPLLSTGFPLALLGVKRLVRLIEAWGQPQFQVALQSYAKLTDAELVVTADLAGALYANLADPPVFNALTLLYFAAASYSETAHRLGRPELAASFLLQNDPRFGPALRECLKAATAVQTHESRARLLSQVSDTIQPFNVAGLVNPDCRNWYPARAEDLYAAAPKLGAGPDEITGLLRRCGFDASSAGAG